MTTPVQFPQQVPFVDSRGRIDYRWLRVLEALQVQLQTTDANGAVIDGSANTYGQMTLYQGADSAKGGSASTGEIYFALDTGKIYYGNGGAWQELSPEFTGDVTKEAGSDVLTLATVFNSAGTYGSGTEIPIITVDSKGRITDVDVQAITITATAGGSNNQLQFNQAGLLAGTTGIGYSNGGLQFANAIPTREALSPLTTKGDIFVRNATRSTRLSVGSNGQFLSANSAKATGLDWRNILFADITETPTTLDGYGIVDGRLGSISTGLWDGCTIAVVNSTTFSISNGTLMFVDYTAPEKYNPTANLVAYAGNSAVTVSLLGTHPFSYVGIAANGTIVQQDQPFTATQRRDIVQLGSLAHQTGALTNVNQLPNVLHSATSQLDDFFYAIGPLNIDGNLFAGATANNLTMQKSAGTIFRAGSNFQVDPKNPHITTQASSNTVTFQYRYANSVTLANTTLIDPTTYQPLGVGTATVGNNRWTVQRIFQIQNGNVRVQYGQHEYATSGAAIAALTTDTFITEESLATNAVLRAFLVIKKECTNLRDATSAIFLEAPKFGGAGGTASTLAGTGTVTQIDVDGGMFSIVGGVTGNTSITTTGTIGVLANAGIIANTTGVYVNASSVNNGILPVLYGGTGVNTSTGTNNVVLSHNSSLTGNTSTQTLLVNTEIRVGFVNSTPFAGQLTVQGAGAIRNQVYSYGNTTTDVPAFIMGRARGDTTTPLALAAGDRMGGFLSVGYNGNTWLAPAAVNFIASEAYTNTAGGSLITFETMNTATTSRSVKFVINSNGAVGFGTSNSVGSAGQILFSNGIASAPYWASVANGFISNTSGLFIQANSGLITNSTGLHVLANNGIVANSTGVWARAANGISVDASGINVLANNGISVTSGGVFVKSSSGLIVDSNGIAVQANNGIIANNDGTFVRAGNGISVTAGGVNVVTSNGLVSNTTGVHFIANSGLFSNTSGVFVNASAIAVGTLPSARLSGTYDQALTLSNTSNILTGNGQALTINATNLTTGTVPAARLPQANATSNGAVLILDSVSNTSISIYAASANSVKTAYDAAIAANTNAGTAYSNAITFAANATNLTNGSVPDGRLSGTYSKALTLSNTNNLLTAANVTSNRFLGNASDSAANPSYTWSGDTTTGMFRLSAGAIGLTVLGVVAMRISNTGNVAIGTGTTTVSRLYAVANTVVSNYSAVRGDYIVSPATNTNLQTFAGQFISQFNFSDTVSISGTTYGLFAVNRPTVQAGNTVTSVQGGAKIDNLRNATVTYGDDSGSITGAQYGLIVQAGHSNTSLTATPVSATFEGIRVSPFFRTGTMTNFYGLRIGTASGTNVPSGSYFSIFSEDANAAMQHAGPVRVGNGSNTLPGFSFNNSSTTGFNRQGADIIGVISAGSESMRISATGNVSIGNTQSTFGKLFVHQPTYLTTSAIRAELVDDAVANGTSQGQAISAITQLNYSDTVTIQQTPIGLLAGLRPTVQSGNTVSGAQVGARVDMLRNQITTYGDDSGRITGVQIAHRVLVGHTNASVTATPVSATVEGVRVEPYFRTGSMTNFYGVRIALPVTGSTFNPSGSYFSLFSEDANATMSHAGPIRVGLGSNTSPGLQFIGDTNTGVVSPGADQVAIVTGGAEELYVNTTVVLARGGLAVVGNTSLGNTTATQARLVVDRTGTAILPSITAGTTAIFAGSSTNASTSFATVIAGNTATAAVYFGDTEADQQGGVLYLNTNDTLSLRAGAGNRMTINSTVANVTVSIAGSGAITTNSITQGVGYATGAGGTVTQATSRTTGVTLNRPTGRITMFSAAGSTTAASFTVTNSVVANTDVVILNQQSGTNKYVLLVTAVNAGSFEITFYTTGGTATDAPVINFSVIKGVTA